MALFSQALKTVLDRTFGGKQSALAAASFQVNKEDSIEQSDISKLIREAAPLTAEKFDKLLSACENIEDRNLLTHAAARDFLGEEQYKLLTGAHSTPTAIVQESLGGPTFQAHFPINPRAEQVLRYILTRLQQDADVEQALILLGKFLELPEPLPTPTPSKGLAAAMADMAAQIDAAGATKRGKSAG